MGADYTPGPRRKRAEGTEPDDDVLAGPPSPPREGVVEAPPGAPTPPVDPDDQDAETGQERPFPAGTGGPGDHGEPPLFGVDLPDPPEADSSSDEQADEPDWQECFTRLSADYDNDRRRWRRQAEEQFRRGQDKGVALVAGLIADLGRLCDHARADEAVTEYAHGFDLVHQAALRLLADQDAICFAVVGDAFDPQRHEALTVADRGLAPGVIVEVVAQGWERDGRVVLPARVVVQS